MGIQVEFNPDLALRNRKEFLAGRREVAECLPEKLEQGQTYSFKKEGQRNYWLEGEIPLLETKGNQVLSRPLASILITMVIHSIENGKVVTDGYYKVIEVFNRRSPEIHFESYKRIKRRKKNGKDC